MLPLPPPQAAFASRHIGLNDAAIDAMLDSVGVSSLTELLDTVIPENIRRQSKMALQPALSEHEMLASSSSDPLAISIPVRSITIV